VWFRKYPRGRTDRQTDTHTETYSPQYCASAPAGEVTMVWDRHDVNVIHMQRWCGKIVTMHIGTNAPDKTTHTRIKLPSARRDKRSGINLCWAHNFVGCESCEQSRNLPCVLVACCFQFQLVCGWSFLVPFASTMFMAGVLVCAVSSGIFSDK